MKKKVPLDLISEVNFLVSLIDHTTLRDDDNLGRIKTLISEATRAGHTVASVCVYLRFVPFIRSYQQSRCGVYPLSLLRVSTVANFPTGTDTFPDIYKHICSAFSVLTDEIDIVVNYKLVCSCVCVCKGVCLCPTVSHKGVRMSAYQWALYNIQVLVSVAKFLCEKNNVLLKVILETGELQRHSHTHTHTDPHTDPHTDTHTDTHTGTHRDTHLDTHRDTYTRTHAHICDPVVRDVCGSAIMCGADFVKTCTGTHTHATLTATHTMLACIREFKNGNLGSEFLLDRVDCGAHTYEHTHTHREGLPPPFDRDVMRQVHMMAKKHSQAHDRTVGIKVSGGVKTLSAAREYIQQARDTLGETWPCVDTFRFGSSSLLNSLLALVSTE